MIAGMKKLTLAATTGDIDRLVRELVWLESVEVVEQAPDAELPPGFYACDNAQNTVSSVIRSLKGAASKRAGFSIWQKGFYDHVIRNDADYLSVMEYIVSNPIRWSENKLCMTAYKNFKLDEISHRASENSVE